MPLPKPSAKEDKSEFIGRCMAETKMISEYKDPKQRYACVKCNGKNAPKCDFATDETPVK